MIIVSTEFEIRNKDLFDLFLKRISRPIGSSGPVIRKSGIDLSTYSIYCPGSPLMIDKKYDPDTICESLSHIIADKTSVSMYIIDDDGSIDTYYISNGRYHQI